MFFRKRGNSIEEKRKKSLDYSVKDASFHAAMVGFGESFFSAFAVFLKATNLQLALLGSLPLSIGSILQLSSEKLLNFFGSRKKFVAVSVLLQALTYIPIMLVFLFSTLNVYHIIFFVSLYFIFGMISSTAWSSWMGELVSQDERGYYFSKRNSIAGFISFFSLLIAGYILQRFIGNPETQFKGFVIIFTLALLFRLMSLVYLLRKYEPVYRKTKDDDNGFINFLYKAKERDYGILILFLCFMNFSVFIAAPFFAAYMLYDLKLTYIEYTIVLAGAVISKNISMPVWGRAIDKYGNRKILTLAGFLMPLVSLLWLFSEHVIYLVFIQIFSGFIWAGFELSTFSSFFDKLMPNKIPKYVSYSNVLNGIALLIGAFLGGLIVKYNSFFWSKYHAVFLISAFSRYLVSFIFIPKLREGREVTSVTYPRLLLNLVTGITTRGLVYDVAVFGRKNVSKFKKRNFP